MGDRSPLRLGAGRVLPVVLAGALMLSACARVNRGTRDEYEVPVGGYCVGAGVFVVGAAVPVLGFQVGLSRGNTSFLDYSAPALGIAAVGAATVIGSFIYHMVSLAGRDSAPFELREFAEGDRVEVPGVAARLFVFKAPPHGAAVTWPETTMLIEACEKPGGRGGCCRVPPGFLTASGPEPVPQQGSFASTPACDRPAVARADLDSGASDWLACPVGAGECNGCCIGGAVSLTHEQAMGSCPEGYRLPTRHQLQALVGGCETRVDRGLDGLCSSCGQSPVCRAVFGEDQGQYWSSTHAEQEAWILDFGSGGATWRSTAKVAKALCIRADAPQLAQPSQGTCEGGELRACFELAKELIGGDGARRDRAKASQLLDTACEAGLGEACGLLAQMLVSGQGIQRDERRARKVLRKGCDAGRASACYDLGILYASGKGGAKDSTKARRFFKKACYAKYKNSCALARR